MTISLDLSPYKAAVLELKHDLLSEARPSSFSHDLGRSQSSHLVGQSGIELVRKIGVEAASFALNARDVPVAETRIWTHLVVVSSPAYDADFRIHPVAEPL